MGQEVNPAGGLPKREDGLEHFYPVLFSCFRSHEWPEENFQGSFVCIYEFGDICRQIGMLLADQKPGKSVFKQSEKALND